jgi:hypothetical protein
VLTPSRSLHTQDLEKREGSFKHVPNLTCAQQMCSKCEAMDELNIDCEQCGKHSHVFWEDPIRKFIVYLRLYKPFADKICYFTKLWWIKRTVSVEVSGTEMGT